MAESTTFVCDACRREAPAREGIMPVPPEGWFALSGGPGYLDPDRTFRGWRVCSVPCVATLARRLELNDILYTATAAIDEAVESVQDDIVDAVTAAAKKAAPGQATARKAPANKAAPRTRSVA